MTHQWSSPYCLCDFTHLVETIELDLSLDVRDVLAEFISTFLNPNSHTILVQLLLPLLLFLCRRFLLKKLMDKSQDAVLALNHSYIILKEVSLQRRYLARSHFCIYSKLQLSDLLHLKIHICLVHHLFSILSFLQLTLQASFKMC